MGRMELRISWLLPVWCLFDLLQFARENAYILMPLALAVPPLAMLAHGLAHAWAARSVGGRLDVLTLGLLNEDDRLSVPARPWALWWSSFAGPLASGLLTGAGALLLLSDHLVVQRIGLYIAFTNGLIALVNLLACAPFDGRRWWRGLLWRLMGMRQGMTAAVMLAYLSAVALLVLAVVFSSFLLIFMGVFCLLASINDHRELQSGQDPVLGLNPIHAPSGLRQAHLPGWWARWRSRRQERAEARLAALADAEQVVLDRLLAKVSAEGLPSLTAGEREQLQAISRRQREGA